MAVIAADWAAVAAGHEAGSECVLPFGAEWRRRIRVPHKLAGAEPDGRQPAWLRRDDVRHREVGLVAIDGEAPLDSAQGAPRARLVLPDDRALALRVESVGYAGLLADHEEVDPVRHRHK